MDSAILEKFPDYELIEDLDKGRKEITLQISRLCLLPIDDWGRPIEDPLDETKYLIKKSKSRLMKFNPQVKVLFEHEERNYYVNIANGINKTTGKKGFLLLNEFKTKAHADDTEVLKDTLYENPQEAFHCGYAKMQDIINQDFKDYLKNKKKELTRQRRKPRKIIRDFIKACNNFETESITRNLDEEVVFEKIVRGKRKIRIKGIKEFVNYVKSSDQELCYRDLKIRSSWSFDSLNSITIGIKHFHENLDSKIRNVEYIGRINFIIENDKIMSIRGKD